MAAEIAERPGTELAGLMGYEGQIAGVGDRIPGRPLAQRLDPVHAGALGGRHPPPAAADRRRRARRRPRARRRELAFVNGGGTGSLARTAAAGTVTELTAGSGFYAPHLFDNYRSLELEPAAFFSLPVVRRPVGGIATLLGGGYLASGAGGRDRLPEPYLPGGLRFDRDEGAGEVQTPVTGAAAYKLRVGDRVYLRHAKAGELCERFDSLYLVEGDADRRRGADLPRRGQGVPLSWRRSTSTRRSRRRSTTSSSCSAITPATRGFAASRPPSWCARGPSERNGVGALRAARRRAAALRGGDHRVRAADADGLLIRKVNLPLRHDGGTITLSATAPERACCGARPSRSPCRWSAARSGAILAAGDQARVRPPARRHRAPRRADESPARHPRRARGEALPARGRARPAAAGRRRDRRARQRRAGDRDRRDRGGRRARCATCACTRCCRCATAATSTARSRTCATSPGSSRPTTATPSTPATATWSRTTSARCRR